MLAAQHLPVAGCLPAAAREPLLCCQLRRRPLQCAWPLDLHSCSRQSAGAVGLRRHACFSVRAFTSEPGLPAAQSTIDPRSGSGGTAAPASGPASAAQDERGGDGSSAAPSAQPSSGPSVTGRPSDAAQEERCASSSSAGPSGQHSGCSAVQARSGAPSSSAVEDLWYDWEYGARIHYCRAGRAGPPLLLVHGFGVGAFHFKPLMELLAQGYRVWAVDLLGQGRSWPASPPAAAAQLAYSTDTWTRQLHHFITQIIGEPAYVAGNSLGGYLAVGLAAAHPPAVRGVLLLNATPFWSFMPRAQARGLLRTLVPWDGALPAPRALRALLRDWWWRAFASEANIRRLVAMVYADSALVDEELVTEIVTATEHEQALDTFTSIIFSPRAELTFDQAAAALTCPVCLIYGRDDPWVVPMWGQRLKRLLPHAAYFEVSPAGHCPHHEAPAAVHAAATAWLEAVEAGEQPAWQIGDSRQVTAASPVASGAPAQPALHLPAASLAAAGSSADECSGSSGSGRAASLHVGSESASGLTASSAGPAIRGSGPGTMAVVGSSQQVGAGKQRVVTVTHVDGSPRNVFERLDAALHAWGKRLRR